MEVVQTKALCKVYGQKRAVDNLSMCVHEGDIYGFIGKNGAGKSTALKMLCSLQRLLRGKSLFSESRSVTAFPEKEPVFWWKAPGFIRI